MLTCKDPSSAEVKTHKCKSCRCHQERSFILIYRYTCKNRRRYSRERTSQSVKVIQFTFHSRPQVQRDYEISVQQYMEAAGQNGGAAGRRGRALSPRPPFRRCHGAMDRQLERSYERVERAPKMAESSFRSELCRILHFLVQSNIILQKVAIFWRSRSRLYLSQFLRRTICFAACFKLYKMRALAHV